MKIKIISIVGIMFLLVSCSHKTSAPTTSSESYSYRNGQISFLRQDEQGTIVIRTNGFGKNINDASINAQKSAFYNLIFKGIPGSSIANVPMVSDEYDAYQKNENYFNNLFDNGHYNTFMMYSNMASEPNESKGEASVSIDVKINYNSLRNDLEQNSVIRKFGY